MLGGAIKNELEKLYYKKRIHLVMGIVLFFAFLMLGLEFFDKEPVTEQQKNWKAATETYVQQLSVQLDKTDQNTSQYDQIEDQRNRLDFYLKQNINPELSGAVGMLADSVTGMLIKIILPILVVIITADILTGEASNGTLKSLLVGPMGRKNIILSKWISAAVVSISAMLLSDLLTYIFAIPFHGFGSFTNQVVIGVHHFTSIPAWLYVVIGLLLNIVLILTLVSVSLLISIVCKTVASSVSLAMSMVIFGSLLGNFQHKIDSLKYFFFTNFDLVSFLTGEFTVQNSSFVIALCSVTFTGMIAFMLSAGILLKRDMLV